MFFRPRLLLPLVFALGACDFFTLDEPDDSTGGAPATGGTGGSGGVGGASGGSGGVGGATGGAGGVIGVSGSGAGGTAGDTSTGGVGGTAGVSTGGVGTGGVAGTAGEGAGMAGTGAAGAATGGASGDGGTAGNGPAGAGGGGPVNCASIQAEAYNGHCYLLNTGAATWPDARDACMSRSPGGHLVTITSQAEQDFVWGIAMQDVWNGATDGLGDDQMGTGVPSTWITGEDISQFNGWGSGEPNNYEKPCPSGSGTCYEHCGFMQMSLSGAWNDEICSVTMPYICEWDSGG